MISVVINGNAVELDRERTAAGESATGDGYLGADGPACGAVFVRDCQAGASACRRHHEVHAREDVQGAVEGVNLLGPAANAGVQRRLERR